MFDIPGLTIAGEGAAPEPPIILVVGSEKSGKSASATTLIDYPNKGDYPLVLAHDASGPDSCALLGYRMPVIKIQDMPGASYAAKMESTIAAVQGLFARGTGRKPTALVVDCASTMADRLYQEAKPQFADGRGAYGYVLGNCSSFLSKLVALRVPTIWYAWLREAFIKESEKNGQKTKRQELGGANITGNFKAVLAGRATMIFVLEKVRAPGGCSTPVGTVPPGSDGFVRLFHTRTWEMIEGGGRYNLPEPMPAHLGFCLSTMAASRKVASFAVGAPVSAPAPQPQVQAQVIR